MSLPHKISTLLYCFNAADEVLLLQRTQEPNRGLWSPPGGKLKTGMGESPYACACREAQEEMGLVLKRQDLQLTGLVSEHGYQGNTHWLMFLFEVRPRLTAVPPPHAEGSFRFFPAPHSTNSRFPTPIVKASGHGFGSIAAVFLPRTATAALADKTTGCWRRVALPRAERELRHAANRRDRRGIDSRPLAQTTPRAARKFGQFSGTLRSGG